MKGKGSRTSRLNGEYQKEISEIIRRLKDKAPDLKGLVSVTEADVAPDLKTAIVYVSIYTKDEAEKQRSFEVLQENAGYIRHELSQVMRMRTVPALTFRMDGSMGYGAKMDELFKKLRENQPATKDEDDEE
ncbi:MAG: 30S ribosome-binding factor RbfA [Clostridia bacterium]|nr:30S ribosome-binding factor RbfA [Clostridia bacterium]